MKLYIVLLGYLPKGMHIEQLNIYFGICETLRDLVPDIITSWHEAEGNLHIDAWR